jgi:pSer/pThr/pTyr-binding forkhead associated (FHA) protein
VSERALDPEGFAPRELQERIAADRRGRPYLLFRDGGGAQRIVSLDDAAAQVTVGRAPGSDLCLGWDQGVSRAHARLERLGADGWMLVDDGLSRNGSIVNGERLHKPRRLADGDMLRFGETLIAYRAPSRGDTVAATVATGSGEIVLTPAQRRVLVALCRPYLDAGEFATPASNRQIAEDLVVSVEAVKTQLRALFEKFEIEPLARDVKRTRLAQRAFEAGVVSRRDLDD